MQYKQSLKKYLSIIVLLISIPIVLLLSNTLGDRKHYVISLAVAFCGIGGLFLSFENRKPKANEIIVLAVMCALAAASRAVFVFIPFFKPLAAIVILTGVAMGAQAGFVCGAVSMLVSNFIFGQGPWTGWQMLAYGLVGLLAGIIFYNKPKRQKIIPIAVFGGLSIIMLAGPILDISGIFSITQGISLNAVYAVLISGLPLNAVQMASTVLFLLLLTKPILEKLDRMKIKYGLMENR